MKKFLAILSFELKSYFKNKIFTGVTAFLLLATTCFMFFPSLHKAFGNVETDEKPVMLVADEMDADQSALQQVFAGAFPDYQVEVTSDDANALRSSVESGDAECAFFLRSLTDYTYFVRSLTMYDTNTQTADELLKNTYYLTALTKSGMTPEQAQSILTTPVIHDIQSLEKEQQSTFLYTYIMIFALYLVIMLYGQMVATSVATEKGSRTMELLITSAKPTPMMFGKVIAAALAGLFQIVAVFGSAIAFYPINREAWSGSSMFDMMISSIFSMPLQLLLYMILFFILGFLLYAFLFGAVGSMASKVEDINTSSMPLMLMLMLAFLVVIYSVIDGTADSMMLKVCSYIPFTSPMAMFTRIAMGAVPAYEILISVAVLVLSVIGVGFISAKIYRVGVLLYGAQRKPGAILRAIREK